MNLQQTAQTINEDALRTIARIEKYACKNCKKNLFCEDEDCEYSKILAALDNLADTTVSML